MISHILFNDLDRIRCFRDFRGELTNVLENVLDGDAFLVATSAGPARQKSVV